MTAETTPPCANCQRLQAQLDALQARSDALQETVAQLQRQLAAARKDSSTFEQSPDLQTDALKRAGCEKLLLGQPTPNSVKKV